MIVVDPWSCFVQRIFKCFLVSMKCEQDLGAHSLGLEIPEVYHLIAGLKIWLSRDSTHQYRQFLDVQGSQDHQEVILLEVRAFLFSPPLPSLSRRGMYGRISDTAFTVPVLEYVGVPHKSRYPSCSYRG